MIEKEQMHIIANTHNIIELANIYKTKYIHSQTTTHRQVICGQG